MTTETPTMLRPSPTEVNALVLTSCFAWRWRSRVSKPSGERLTALLAGEDDLLGYHPTNYYVPEWSDSDATAPRFTDWDRGNIKHDQRRLSATFTLPDFCRDRNLVARWLWPLLGEDPATWDTYLHIVGQARYGEIHHAGRRKHTASPAIQTEAVLRTLGVWPSTWGSVVAEGEEG